jgi:DnaJ-domain-containing protein 1
MNLPETLDRIQRDLRGAIARFLDTAPEKALLFRTSAILGILKHYFEQEISREDGDAYDKATAEEVLVVLGLAKRQMRTDEQVEKWVAEIMESPPMTDEELDKKLKGWEALEARLKAEGKEHWWD